MKRIHAPNDVRILPSVVSRKYETYLWDTTLGLDPGLHSVRVQSALPAQRSIQRVPRYYHPVGSSGT